MHWSEMLSLVVHIVARFSANLIENEGKGNNPFSVSFHSNGSKGCNA